MSDTEHKKILDISKKSTATVFLKPLSKLARVKALKGIRPPRKTFCAIKYPEHGNVAWRYKEDEIWVERPWLDEMVSNGKEEEATSLIVQNTTPIDKEKPLEEYDTKIIIPVYVFKIARFNEVKPNYYYQEVVDKTLESLNDMNDGYKYYVSNSQNHDLGIPIREVEFTREPISPQI